ARRQGVGARLLAAFEAGAAARGAARVHLEVAADNLAARALYDRAGWHLTGRRQGYFRRPGGPAADALLMAKALKGAASDP
ncbi:MAG: GNAT family N-acetyltransferase, partial [Gemmobacter sp.]